MGHQQLPTVASKDVQIQRHGSPKGLAQHVGALSHHLVEPDSFLLGKTRETHHVPGKNCIQLLAIDLHCPSFGAQASHYKL
jgi:hypothetical protein